MTLCVGRWPRVRRWANLTGGASTLTYGLVLGLVSVLSVGVIEGTGRSVTGLFDTVATDLAGGAGCRADSLDGWRHRALVHRESTVATRPGDQPEQAPADHAGWQYQARVTCENGAAVLDLASVQAVATACANNVVPDADGQCVNRAGTTISFDGGAPTVPEDMAPGSAVGSLITDDPEGDAITFTLQDDAGGLFTLDALDSTQVRLAAGLDYEGATGHTIIVVADDGQGNTWSARLSIAVGPVDEPDPVISAPADVTDLTTAEPPRTVGFTVATPGGVVLTGITAASDTPGVVTASIGGTLAAPALILTPTGVGSASVTITATDQEGSSATATVAVTVNSPIFGLALQDNGTPGNSSDDYRTFSDGSAARSCSNYLTPASGFEYSGDTGNGRYAIDHDANAATDPLIVRCEMDSTTDGGGWTICAGWDGQLDNSTSSEGGRIYYPRNLITDTHDLSATGVPVDVDGQNDDYFSYDCDALAASIASSEVMIWNETNDAWWSWTASSSDVANLYQRVTINSGSLNDSLPIGFDTNRTGVNWRVDLDGNCAYGTGAHQWHRITTQNHSCNTPSFTGITFRFVDDIGRSGINNCSGSICKDYHIWNACGQGVSGDACNGDWSYVAVR